MIYSKELKALALKELNVQIDNMPKEELQPLLLSHLSKSYEKAHSYIGNELSLEDIIIPAGINNLKYTAREMIRLFLEETSN